MQVDVTNRRRSATPTQRISLAGLLLLALAGLLLAPQQARASWWNHEWAYRKLITIDAGARGADVKNDLTDVPVLVRLHEGVFKFSDANADGADLRFVAEDDRTPLKFHIEKLDSVFNLGVIWVSLPKLQAGGQTRIWMYYGNSRAVAGSDARGTYDPGAVLVYHFAERGTPVQDSTGYANNSSWIAPVDEAGPIGTGAKFDGHTEIGVPASSSLAVAAGGSLTWSAWIKPATADGDGVIYSWRDGAKSLLIGLAGGAPYVSVTGEDGSTQRSAPTQPLGNRDWHLLAVVAERSQVQLFVDGKPAAALAASLPALATAATLGADHLPQGAPGNPGPNFVGELDELTISKVARTPDYLQIAAMNQGANDRMVEFGADEQLSSWASGYAAVILSSVTFDGWVIIGILAVMAALSWYVMVLKVRQINRAAAGNKSFMTLFHASGGEFSALSHGMVDGARVVAGQEISEGDRALIQAAPLFRVFTCGVDELRQRLSGGGGEGGRSSTHLSAQAIEAMRASLASSLVDESNDLDRSMVMLTIAISGGPFLGLLGTVVGVMITFAAIAVSGDVNINSIAPGISAALVATVAGLAVAIPALFGYNYLTVRIRRMISSMRVFVDLFITRISESYKVPAHLGWTGEE